jgi:hypothetical protein
MPIIGGRQIGVRGLGFQGAGKPSVPTSVSAIDVGTGRAFNNGAANVSWTAPSSNGAPITSYTVISSPGSFTATTSSTSVQITGLQSSTSYTYSVTATNAVGVSDPGISSAVTATTIPQAPTIGTATDGDTGTTAIITYTAGATGGKTVSAYTATSSPGSLTSTGASPITVSGLTTGTSYTFTVTATNANGTSTASAASNSLAPRVPPSFDSIATFTPTSGTQVTFSSIPQTYKSLQLRIQWIATAGTNGSIYAKFNGSSSNYTNHGLYAAGSTVYADNPYGTPSSFAFLNAATQGNIVNNPNVFIIDIIDYASTSKTKVLRRVHGQNQNDTGQYNQVQVGSTLWNDTSAISSILINADNGFAAGTSIALYGVK